MNVVFSFGKSNDKKSDRQNINIRVYHSGFDFRRTTGLEISQKDWDFDKRELKFNKVQRTPDELRYARSVQEQLDDIKRAFQREFDELKLSHKLKSQNSTSWNEWCEITLNKGLGIVEEVSEEIPFLVDTYSEYIEIKKQDQAQNTIKGLKSNLKVLQGFLDYDFFCHNFKLTAEQRKDWSIWYAQNYGRSKSNKLRFNETDLKFYRTFREWNKLRGNDDNYFFKIIGNLKVVLRYFNSVDSKKYPVHDHIRHKDFKSDKLSRPHSVLSEDELNMVFNFKGNERLENISSLAKILYYGCFRYSEMKQELKRMEKGTLEIVKRIVEGREVDYWNIYQGKPKIHKKVPINSSLNKALFESNFHLIESQNFNDYLKELLELLSIKKEYKITSHTFRRSFITNMVNRGYSPTDIMEYSGHKTEAQFREYCKRENIELKTLNPIYLG